MHNRIAFKTGTSYGYRDAWSVGFDGRMTIGVWVGRPDGAPVPGLVGRTAAAPILFDAFARTGKLPAAVAEAAQGRADGQQRQTSAAAAAVSAVGRTGPDRRRAGAAYPVPAQWLADRRFRSGMGQSSAAMPVKVAGGVLPMTMLVNGVSVGEIDSRRQRLVDPPGPGFARLTVIDATGAADTVVVRIQ